MPKNLWKCEYWKECGEPCVVTDKEMKSNKPLCKKNQHTSWAWLDEDTCKFHDVIRCYDLSDCAKCPQKN